MKTDFEQDEIATINGEMDVDDFVEKHFEYLYDVYSEDMPYGTQKASDGDPYEWLCEHFDLKINY